MDYRGTAVVGVWIGTAAIIGILNYTQYLAGASLWLVFAAFVLTGYIVKLPQPGEADIRKIDDLDKRMSTIEKNVEDIKKLLEE